MSKLQLQLNKKIAALSAEHPFEYVALRYLCAVAFVLVLGYLYFVSASVLNVIAQREADQTSAALESKIGALEGKYFELSAAISLDQATKLGLKPLEASSFVYRLGTVGVVAVAQNAI